MYIGLTGYMGTGKGEIAKILQERGYRYISLSDAVREEAKKLGVEESRENLQNVGNDLRKKYGSGVLGERIKEKIYLEDKESFGNNNWVIDGIRHPKELEEIKKIPNSQVLALTANLETIVERIKQRGRFGERQAAREEIIEKLKRESGVGEEDSGQQVQKCLENADFLIINEGTIEDLTKKLDHFINLYNGEDRPTFDEIFMEIAYTWSKRATCLRRQVGAVIAKDKQQLTAGYNGAPRGIPHCAEVGGCLREKLNIPSGKNAELCRGTHAEQNTITQAAKFGIDIEGSTLYCNTFPCVICTKMILNSGIVRVVYDSDYDDPLSKEILAQQNIVEMIRYEGKKFPK